MENVFRVFFHELGHFVARELNLKYFNGTGSAEILIYPCENDNNDFCGHLRPISPEELNSSDNTPVPLERLAEHLVVDVYGCIFQSYYLNSDFKNCTETNGEEDIKKWIGSLFANKLSYINRDIFPICIEYFEYLKSEHLLDAFMRIEPKDYLITLQDNKYCVDLNQLRNDISEIVEFHFQYYKLFVTCHQKIIDRNSH